MTGPKAQELQMQSFKVQKFKHPIQLDTNKPKVPCRTDGCSLHDLSSVTPCTSAGISSSLFLEPTTTNSPRHVRTSAPAAQSSQRLLNATGQENRTTRTSQRKSQHLGNLGSYCMHLPLSSAKALSKGLMLKKLAFFSKGFEVTMVVPKKQVRDRRQASYICCGK